MEKLKIKKMIINEKSEKIFKLNIKQYLFCFGKFGEFISVQLLMSRMITAKTQRFVHEAEK